MMDLRAHEEEKRPMFFALIMATIAMTLIHVNEMLRRSRVCKRADGSRSLDDSFQLYHTMVFDSYLIIV